jgi:hypothetical protein
VAGSVDHGRRRNRGRKKLPNSRQQGQETDADPTKYPLSPLVKQEFRILSWGAKRRDGRLEGRGGEAMALQIALGH